MRSDAVKTGSQQAPHRSLFNALGLTKEEMERPQQEFRSVHGSQEVRSCGNVPDIMYCCFWELKFWE